MSRQEKQRGKNFEYRVVNLAKGLGLPSRRIPLSGSAQEKLDVEIAGMRFECKYRGREFVQIYRWLEKAVEEGGKGLIISSYRKEPLVIVPAKEYFEFLKFFNSNVDGFITSRNVKE